MTSTPIAEPPWIQPVPHRVLASWRPCRRAPSRAGTEAYVADAGAARALDILHAYAPNYGMRSGEVVRPDSK